MEEMRNCGQQFSSKDIEAIFALGDVNNDGEIDMSEFVAVMCPSASTVVARISKGYKTLADVKAAFKKLDRDGDGNISKSEMAAAGLNEQEVNAIFALGDANNDGQIDMDEFIMVMCPSANAVVFKISQLFSDKNGAQQAFKKIDINNDGLISKEEMSNAVFVNSKLSPVEVDAIFQLGDINKDGEIDLDEFLGVMIPITGATSSMSVSSSFHSTTVTSSSFSSVKSTSYCSVGMTFGSVSDAKSAFQKFDINGDGVMDKDEMKKMMGFAAGKDVSSSEVDAMFKKGDLDGDGQIDMQEFIKLMFPQTSSSLTKLQEKYKSLNEVRAAFRKCDSDGDGHISLNELRAMMSGFSGAEVDAVFALADKDQSGGIDFNEFIAFMVPNSGSILKKVSSKFTSIQQIV